MNQHPGKSPSLLEGLDIPDKNKDKGRAKSAPARRDVATAAASRTTSLDWTPGQKKMAAIGLAAAAAAALVVGAFAVVRMRPLEMPKTFEEAKVAMETSKFKNLDDVRKGQYQSEVDRLIREKTKDMTDEQRRAFFRDDSNRDVLMQVREQQFDDMARKLARGEKIEFPFGPGGPGGGPPGFRGPRDANASTQTATPATLASFQPRPGDEPPSPAPRTNDNRREWGPPGNNQGGPNNAGNQANPNRPGNAPGQNAPNQNAPGNNTPGNNNSGNNPGGGNSAPNSGNAPAAGGGNSGGGNAAGGGGGRRGSPVSRMANRIQKGNAQSNGLRFEAMKKMMANAPRQGDPNQAPAVRIAFVSGSSELNEAAFTSIGAIAKQLTDQPETSVRIWGLVDPRTDGAKLKFTALRDSFAVKMFGTGAKGEQLTKDQLEQQVLIAYNELLARQASEAGKPPPALVGPNSEVAAPPLATMEEALVAGAPIPTDLLITLAQARQDAIKKDLIDKRAINPVRVRTVGVAPQFMENDRPCAILQVAR